MERWWVDDVASIDVFGDNVVVVSLYKVVHPSSIQFSDYSTMHAGTEPASKLDPAAPLLLPRPLSNFTSGISRVSLLVA